ncbi:MAG: uracil phosphoribosyltransferase [Bacteroidetes bacterium]|nr:uracil phosphoribosyltransferase [Bacteroidota bacterium]
MVNILGSHNSVLNVFLAEMRDVEIQKDRMRFRRNMERMGEIFAYEISKTLPYQEKEVVTTLGSAQVMLPTICPVLATILRAGLPLHQGLLNFFDHSDNAFVSAFRKPNKNGTFKIELEYVSSPEIEDRILILCDPMLATGASILLAYKSLLAKGKPKHTHIVSVLASQEGVEFLKSHLSQDDVTIWVGAIDDELTAQAYIVPGLGDAGDLSFGSKYDRLL